MSEPRFGELALNLKRATASARLLHSSEVLHAWGTTEQGDVVLTLSTLDEIAVLLERARIVYRMAERAADEHDKLMGAEWVRDILRGDRDG